MFESFAHDTFGPDGRSSSSFLKSLGNNPLEFAGGILPVLGNTFSQVMAQDIATKFETQQLEFNAKMALFQAKDALRLGSKNQSLLGQEIQRVQGSQVAAAAALGLDVNVGSPADIVANTQALGFEDQKTLADDAWMQSWALKQQAQQYSAQSRIARIQGGMAIGQTLSTGGMAAIDKSLKFYDKYK